MAAQQLTSLELLELLERLKQFKNMPPEQKILYLGFIACSRCKDEEANLLFDKFCKEEVNQKEKEKDAFFDHIGQCSLCYNAFLRLVWLSTDFDGH